MANYLATLAVGVLGCGRNKMIEKIAIVANLDANFLKDS
jgi:hypothetical protein